MKYDLPGFSSFGSQGTAQVATHQFRKTTIAPDIVQRSLWDGGDFPVDALLTGSIRNLFGDAGWPTLYECFGGIPLWQQSE